MQLWIHQSVVKTAVVKVTFGHLAGTIAVADMASVAAKMTEAKKVAFAS